MTDRPIKTSERQKGLRIEYFFSSPGVHPFDQLEWETRSARITADNGQVIFQQDNIEAPASWSQLAVKVVASKYFYGDPQTGQRESSIKQLIHRVCRTIADRGKRDGYFASDADAEAFYNELAWLCVNQYGSFNSPVWFNVGLYDVCRIEGSPHNYHWDPTRGDTVPCTNTYEYPQASACFIQSVQDNMEDIMRLATSEAMLFKHGSGTGTDLSTLRSSKERLSGGGRPSGPISFMRVYDQIAAVIKSGGKTRRAAKMQSLRIDHPDIKEFICAKMEEEKKAWALIEAGYTGDHCNEAYNSVMFQNSNLSVRVTDEFMEAVEKDGLWQTRAVTTGQVVDTYRARELFDLIAEATRVCGDPGIQYHTTINRWHTCPNSGPINASNPCSEYMFIDDSACNLASLNLMKFRRPDGTFDVEAFQKAVRIFIIAQEILVDNSSYPEPRIVINSHRFRPLGLGYANLGALLMSLALPYDSDQARAMAAAITAIMTGSAYLTSAQIAAVKGPFEEFPKNREPMLRVIEMHRQHAYSIPDHCPDYLRNAARQVWDKALDAGTRYGFRNAQATVLAPTGTIGFMMDCDTTGIEPDIALVKYKLLAGGGMLKLVNRTVPMALERLGYSPEEIKAICDHLDKHENIETAPGLNKDHLPVFDCAFRPKGGSRCIHYMAHLRMMAAVQPFLSGAISKTINVPNETTADQIAAIYMEGWKLGLKAVAIYRDGSKRLQPVSTDKHKQIKTSEQASVPRPYRRRLPDTRQSITHKFSVAGHEGYLTVGLYEDGQPGELFITMAKEGSTIGGLMDVIGTCVSMALQYGVPLSALVDKFRHARFEPSGMTSNRDIPFAKSLIDYIFCWLGCQFIPSYAEKNIPSRATASLHEQPATAQPELPSQVSISRAQGPGDGNRLQTRSRSRRLVGAPVGNPSLESAQQANWMEQFNAQFAHFQDDAPACDICGAIMVRNGTCYKCFNCGNSMGCS
ncbi:MAG: vitamin B12-dependent ribonucleotide reductase [Sedimentisphaerales bacterium]|jgi:ribonucleoside-diphosphate reductase alpha chain|nr:vitamin B12-dependent ribonucleotide reductase [Sedimentisphaerales bacterium]